MVVTDFEITFTGDLFKFDRQNNHFVFKVSIPANGCRPVKNSGEQSRAILAVLFWLKSSNHCFAHIETCLDGLLCSLHLVADVA